MKSVNNVAAEFNISPARLKRVLKNMLQLELVSDKVSSTDLIKIIDKIGVSGGIEYPVPSNVYDALVEQYKHQEQLEPIKAVAKQYQVNYHSLIEFIDDGLGGVKKALVAGYLQYNVFKGLGKPEVYKTNVTRLMNKYFINLASKTRHQTAFLQLNGKKAMLSLLEEVKDKHSARGHIIGFGLNDDSKLTAIVAYTKKDPIIFMPDLQEMTGMEDLRLGHPVDTNKSPVQFIIKFADLRDKAGKKSDSSSKDKIAALNVLLYCLGNHGYSIRPWLTDGELCYIVTTNSFDLNLHNEHTQPDNLKYVNQNRLSLFNDISAQKMVEYLKDHVVSNALIKISNMDKEVIYVRSNLAVLRVFVDRDSAKDIEKSALANGTTASGMVNEIIQIFKVALKTNNYQNIFQVIVKMGKLLEKEKKADENRSSQENKKANA